MMTIAVNGESRSVKSGTSVLDLLRELGLEPERVAVELERRIVKKAQWPSTILEAGAKLEIVQFVGGG